MGITPLVPTAASLLFAVFWALSAFAGWGLAAFCADARSGCAERLDTAVLASALFVAVAVVLTAAAWLNPPRFSPLITAALFAWLAAVGTLFFGGMLAA